MFFQLEMHGGIFQFCVCRVCVCVCRVVSCVCVCVSCMCVVSCHACVSECCLVCVACVSLYLLVLDSDLPWRRVHDRDLGASKLVRGSVGNWVRNKVGTWVRVLCVRVCVCLCVRACVCYRGRGRALRQLLVLEGRGLQWVHLDAREMSPRQHGGITIPPVTHNSTATTRQKDGDTKRQQHLENPQ